MKKFEKMEVIFPHAAGIDVGSASHFVATGQELSDVKEFGIYSSDQLKMIAHLKEKQITTIAMESTGSYWQSLFFVLQEAGFDVNLVSGRQTKNIRAKTDPKDSRWIQKLHSLGLLQPCFLPNAQTARLRTLHRHRESLKRESEKMVNKIQKSLRLMNVRLDVILADTVGKSGKKIIEAILEGQRDGVILAELADKRVKKTKTEIADALVGQWNEELLYELKDCYELFTDIENKILLCDNQISALLKKCPEEMTPITNTIPTPTPEKRKSKKQTAIDVQALGKKFYGVDLFAIECVGSNSVLTLISEIGHDIYKFPTAKHFVSYLRLAPNNRISGGKLISSRTPKGGSRLSLCLRNAVNSMDRVKNSRLSTFFKRIAFRHGRGAAITATARKVAIIIWNMIVKKEPYQPIGFEDYNQMMKQNQIRKVKRMITATGISVTELFASPK